MMKQIKELIKTGVAFPPGSPFIEKQTDVK